MDLAHAPQRVWRALTDRDALDGWFIPGGWQPVAGAQFRITPGTDQGLPGPVDVEVLEVVAGRRLVMQWSADTLHAEMTWELVPTGSGCRLSVAQSGFLGTPQSVRARQLRSAYWQMFARALPAMLAAQAAGDPAAAWPRPTGRDDPGTTRSGGGRRLLPAWSGVAGVGRRVRGWLSRWEGYVTAAATFVVIALAVVVLIRSSPAAHVQATPPMDAPAQANAPTTTVTAETQPAPTPAGSARPGAGAAQPPPATATGATGRTVEPAPIHGAAAGRLSATYQTLKVLANGNYAAQVSMTATGGALTGWTVVITVPDGAVVALTSGATVAQDTTTVTFTPDGNAQINPGQIVSFTFRVRKPAGTTAPLSCTANGQPCAGLSG